ncbi:bifunctional folylpolyglutamate synthase/dihydrofolate synthase [Shouchella lonarensis]|uniref:Dihydrofolate synthase/folylpolyglutamate synthase n=1 Tax=Shouchella lonarensis TaxID=1464122 RepID=A0A1G6GHZ4_9BACI|nr:folylpolyglutamate synthase/dihydrofolate synthase family protein [Shouchella lonarensis]SDB81463.1 dihydrofolate synthase / folylpolyglutamate synthase [Shouchella lonarensis]
MKTAEEAIAWIHSLLPFGIKPGLARMEAMLAALDHPEEKLQAIHVAGTNGKGSTVSFLRHMLQADGWSVGTFTSPYVEQFAERISMNGVPIGDADLLAAAQKIRPLVEEIAKTPLGSPTEFEVLTAMMLWHFGEVVRPDICLVEVGLGGRMDSTNVISPLVSVITTIGYDHMHILGDTLSEIAYEKAGIIKPGTPVVVGNVPEEALAVIGEVAVDKQASLTLFGADFGVETDVVQPEPGVEAFEWKWQRKPAATYKLAMIGPHQRENAAVALATLSVLEKQTACMIREETRREGLKQASWPGRFEYMQQKPDIILDGAHNKEGYEALAAVLEARYPGKKMIMLLAATREKDICDLLAPFHELDIDFMFTTFDFPRAQSAEVLYERAEVASKRCISDWRAALTEVREQMAEEDVLVVAGSLYFVSDVRRGFVG